MGPGSGSRAPRLRYAGVAAVVTLWGCVGAGMYRAGLGFFDERPISYLGTDPRSQPVFRAGLVVAALLVAGFAWFVRDRFRAPDSFLVATLIGLVGQVVVAVVPLSGPAFGPLSSGTAHAVHTTGGIVLGLSLPLLMWRFALGQVPGLGRALSYRLCWLEVVACALGLWLSASGRAPVAEIVPAAGFHLWIVVVTVWSRRDQRLWRERPGQDGSAGGRTSNTPVALTGLSLHARPGSDRTGTCGVAVSGAPGRPHTGRVVSGLAAPSQTHSSVGTLQSSQATRPASLR